MTTIAVRNLNPGNIRKSLIVWQGEGPSDDGQAYCKFTSAKYGFRALAVNLLTYYKHHQLKTVRGIITRFAPKADNNPTDAYIANVCDALGVEPDKEISLTNRDTLTKLCRAIAVQESGSWQFEQKDLDDGISAALV